MRLPYRILLIAEEVFITRGPEERMHQICNTKLMLS
jgi:hypothetical protein